ncbi:MAG: phage portal protein [Lachnospira sp.]|jgi:SPP1 family phage portal protein|nr:phage portal protein [Lachnospira sp.]
MSIAKTPISKVGGYIKDLFKSSIVGKISGGKMLNTDYWFEAEIKKSKYTNRISRVSSIDEYLCREHQVLSRPNFEFKGKTFETAKIILQTLKSVIKFHASYIVGNPISITGDKEFVAYLNSIYKKGNFNKIDLNIAKDLISFGDSFEYLYLDENDNIQSKVIRNKDSYPLYDSMGKYYSFVEYWKDSDTRVDMYVVYYQDKVEIYENNKLIDSKINLTGLPIWYSSMDKFRYDKFGDPITLDLIPLIDVIENLLSKLDDAVTTLSLNPLGVISGQRIDSSIPNNIVGAVLNLEDGSEFKYASVQMDRNSIKLELDYIIQQFFSVACVPSSILGQSNVANVSETSITMLFQQTDNFARMYIMSLLEGFKTRLKYIRKLMEYQGKTISDEIFYSIDFEFNVARPVDTKTDFENMKIQFDAGALSRRTFIDKSKYTTNTPLELERLSDELSQSSDIVTPVSGFEDIETEIDKEVN